MAIKADREMIVIAWPPHKAALAVGDRNTGRFVACITAYAAFVIR